MRCVVPGANLPPDEAVRYGKPCARVGCCPAARTDEVRIEWVPRATRLLRAEPREELRSTLGCWRLEGDCIAPGAAAPANPLFILFAFDLGKCGLEFQGFRCYVVGCSVCRY